MAKKTAYEQPKEGVSISREVGGTSAPSGLYRHEESGQEVFVQDDPLYGDAQGQAFLRFGFKFVRPLESGDRTSLPELAIAAKAAEESTTKGLSARIDKLEGVAEENVALKAEVEQLRAEKLARDQVVAPAEETLTEELPVDVPAEETPEETPELNQPTEPVEAKVARTKSKK